jgi:hypothetical protein
MSADINVFVRTDESLGEMASVISTALGVKLSLGHGVAGLFYDVYIPDMWVVVFEARDYDVDRDMDFPSYSIQIDLGPLTAQQDHDDHVREVAKNLARLISDKLHCATMVTKDLQHVLWRFGE